MRRIFAGFAVTSFLMLGISSAAYAYDPQLPATCDGGNNVPDGSFTGGVISSPGGCTLSESITASSAVSVTSDGAVNVTGSLSAPGVSVQSTGSSVSVGAISSSAYVWIYAKDVNNTVYNDINLNGNISSALETLITGRNITSAVPLTSATVTSHGGGKVNLVALKGAVYVNNDSGDVNIVGVVGDTTTPTVYIVAGQTIGVGNIKISGAVSTTSAAGTNVQLLAGGNISTGAITSPYVEVLANKFGITGTRTFLLGGGGTNGISGAVTAKNTTGGGGYIDIENGYQTGTGNMTVTAGDVVETGTTGNFIGLYAHGGTLVLPGGTTGKITAGGPLSQVALVGKTVNFVNDTNISSDYLTGGSAHSVVIEADTINYAGTSVVTANGSGQDSSNTGTVFVQGYTSGTTQVKFVGTAGAKISLGADGDHTYTQVYADAILFATGAATLHSQGTTDHGVYLTNVTDTNVNDNLTVASGTLTLDASGAKGAGGTVSVDVYKAVLDGTLITLNANGPSTGDGAGGTITYTATSTTTLGATTQVSLTANAASSGSGNASAQAITLNSGSSITLGSNSTGEFALAANGGNTGGNAGTIVVNAGAANTVTFDVPNIGPLYSFVTARASGTGIGGTVQVVGKAVSKAGKATPINVNGDIRVDGGASVGTVNSDGKIMLNGTTCQQWSTGFNVFPKTYWNCVDGNRATGLAIATAANKLENQLQTQLATTLTPANSSVQIYYMPIIDSWANYFQTTEQGAKGVYGDSINSIRVSAAFVSIYAPVTGTSQASTAAVPPASSGSATIVQAAIIHELAHELDYIWGNQSVNNQTYLTARTNDLTTLLNSGACTNAFTAATCQSNVNTWAALNNLQRYGSGSGKIAGLGYSTSNIELFALVFEHIESIRTAAFAAPPDLESAIKTQFLDMPPVIQGLINNPPAAVN